jgi:hypothetical protein
VDFSSVEIRRVRIGGTLTLAKNFSRVAGLITRTPKLSESPEIYGMGEMDLPPAV